MGSNISSYALNKTEALFRTKNDESNEWITWIVKRFRVEENLGEPYGGSVDIVTSELHSEVISLAGADCVLEIDRGSEQIRRFCGIVTMITHLGNQNNKIIVQIQFGPALNALNHGDNSRTFEDMTTTQIVETVLNEGLKPFNRSIKTSLKNEQEPRTFCVQYEESDLAFVTRLMADEGMFYYFEQEENREVVVVVDANESCPELDTMGYDGDANSNNDNKQQEKPKPRLVEGSTYSDVTPRKYESEQTNKQEPKIKFTSPNSEYKLFYIKADSGTDKQVLLEVAIENASEAQNVSWTVNVSSEIKKGKAGIQPNQEGNIIEFVNNTAQCESKIINGKATAMLYCGETHDVKLSTEAKVDGAKSAKCEIDVLVVEVHNKKVDDALKDIPPDVYRKNGKIHVVVRKEEQLGSDRLKKLLDSSFEQIIAQCNGFQFMWFNDNFWKEEKDFPKNAKEHGRYLEMVVSGMDVENELRINVNLYDYVTSKKVEYNYGKLKLSPSDDFDNAAKGLIKKLLDGLNSIMEKKHPGTV